MVTGTYVAGDDSNTVIVVMKMENIGPARQFAAAQELPRRARARRVE